MIMMNEFMRRSVGLLKMSAVGSRPFLEHHRMLNRAPMQHSPFLMTKKSLWKFLYYMLNIMDNERKKEVGPDRICAEWLLKCGANVRWKDSDKPMTDYLHLPSGNFDVLKIEEVVCVDSYIMQKGFPHFDGCKHIERITFHNCTFVNDGCIQCLETLKDSLKHVQLTSCKKVTDKGVMDLGTLKSLETLLLSDLKNVRNKDSNLNYLQTHLPNCHIEWPEKLPQDKIPKNPIEA